jgi:DNA end-binding protein Ku
LGTYVLRSKESLGLIKTIGDTLVLQKIRFQEEIRKPDELNLPAGEPKATELKMAIALIDQLSADFDISKFKDTYTKELMKLIEAKAKGKKIKAPTMKVVHSKSKDLMAQLKASLESKDRKAS